MSGIGAGDKSLLDYYSQAQLMQFVEDLHGLGKEEWIAGSLGKEDLAELWAMDVDVICVRGAACEPVVGDARFGEVTAEIVASLIETMAAT